MSTQSSYLVSQEQYLSNPVGVSADRERQTRKFDRMIEHTGLDEELSTDESRLAFVDNLSPEDFVHLLREMNGIFLNLPSSQRNLADGLQISREPGNVMPIDVHPAKEDKESLLQEVLSTAQSMPQLEDKALILAVGINAVHPFIEGNGRVARATHYLLTKGYHKGDPQLQAILGPEGEKIITPDPNALRPPILGNMQLNMGTHELDTQKHAAVPKLPVCITDRNFNPMTSGRAGQKPTEREQEIAGILLQEDFSSMIPILALNYCNTAAVQNAVVEIEGKPHFAINLFWEQATEEDFSNFYEMFRMIKNGYVKELLKQLTLGEQSTPMLAPSEDGKLEVWPMAVLMKAITTGDKGMQADKFKERLDRFNSQNN